MSATKMRNIGPKSAAWLRQVGLRTLDDLAAVGTVDAFMRVKRAGFKPGLNLLYAIEGALLDCHWQDVPEDRRHELILAADAATALLPPPRNRPAAGPVTTTMSSRNGNGSGEHEASGISDGAFESDHGADHGETSYRDDDSSATKIED
ncbi:MAG TPA: TfoX/Sxy family protein [Lysobacter sp.]|nr:TfoX/Sxy family protein [Lysobacter sp.]